MTDKDIRWIQRLSNFHKALSTLEEAIALSEKRTLTKLEKQGMIQSFEYTHELAWKVMQDVFHEQGDVTILGSRDATREAFSAGLIEDGEGWMDMIKKRNLTSHTYNEETAEEIYQEITEKYFHLFKEFEKTMIDQKNKK